MNQQGNTATPPGNQNTMPVIPAAAPMPPAPAPPIGPAPVRPAVLGISWHNLTSPSRCVAVASPPAELFSSVLLLRPTSPLGLAIPSFLSSPAHIFDQGQSRALASPSSGFLALCPRFSLAVGSEQNSSEYQTGASSDEFFLCLCLIVPKTIPSCVLAGSWRVLEFQKRINCCGVFS
ncbi:uncharacterized protein LOC122022888 [Zingiber officinale]|uniref:uncharacterized protein LOC122022888 n=1 Tax=Zingiber officinale TaxID=94328 RepID=UPI001C4AC539|nr:uncharacterized protein LOC122022888 [Zingiber officinale]